MTANLSKDRTPSEVRTFVALEIPEDVRSILLKAQRELEEQRSALKIVDPSLIHLTIRFLGNVSESRIAQVTRAAADAALKAEPFTLSLSRPGAFPERSSTPRVVWIGLERDEGFRSLQGLFESLEESLAAAGFERESRPLSPHLTLARVRREAGRDAARQVGTVVRNLTDRWEPHGTFMVNGLTVFKSDLGRQGPRYTALAVAPLGRRGDSPA